MIRTLYGLIAVCGLTLSVEAEPVLSRSESTTIGRYDHYDAFPSKKVIPRDVVVYVPEGPAPEQGYTVLYMHDGHNLFDPKTAMAHEPWAVDEAIHAGHHAVIVVGIENTQARWSEYVPITVVASLPPTLAVAARGSEADPVSDAYVDFITDELKPFIDQHYPTRNDAAHTLIAGSSMGGLISIYAMERRPDIFGRAAGLSTHWPATVNFSLFGQGPESADPRLTEIAHHTVDTLADELPDPKTHRLWVDYGDQTLDRYYAPYAQRFEERARRRGWGEDALRVKAFPGTAHHEPAWRSRFPEVLEFLLKP